MGILKEWHHPFRGDTGYLPLRHAVNTSMYARGRLPAGHGLSGKCPISPLGVSILVGGSSSAARDSLGLARSDPRRHRVLPPETRREPLHGGSEPASLQATVSRESTRYPRSGFWILVGGSSSADRDLGELISYNNGGNRLCSSLSRNNLNNLRAAAGGLPSLASLLALRINWRRVCALKAGNCSSNSDKAWSLPAIKLSRQAST